MKKNKIVKHIKNIYHLSYLHKKITASIFFFWILINGFSFSPKSIFFGFVSVYFAVQILIKSNIITDNKSTIRLGKFGIVKYILVLLKEIACSAIQVANIILKKQNISSNSGITKINIKKDATNTERILFANMITMTPGTVTISIDKENGHYIVHALRK